MRTRVSLTWAGCLLVAGFSCTAAQDAGQAREREPVIGGPCEGCEAVFQGLPPRLEAGARIAPADVPGEPMRIEGTAYDAEGRPAPSVIVYAYHTDASGVYPPDERFPGRAAYRHGRLRGWARTDDRGRYRFDTIRPASYPGRTDPAHVHMHVIEPGRFTYWIDSIHFDDDPLLTREEREAGDGRGGSGMTHPERDASGVWVVRRDIRLGLGVPGYPAPAGALRAEPRQAPLFATEPEWSRQGTLVFAAGAWPDLDLYTWTPDADAPRRILHHDSTDYMPSWSPDGRSVVFASTRSGRHDLYVLSLPSGDVHRLGADGACENSEPRWSPDGVWIAFRAECEGDRDIFRIRPDGSGLMRLTDTPGEDGEPSWSPDSRRIVFSSARTGTVEVFVMAADGSGQTRLTHTPEGYSRRPEWSPDGGTLSFGSNREGNDEIYTMSVDGSGLVNVSRDPAREYYSRWSPDGRRIVFTSNRERNGVIYEMNRDGTNVRRLCCSDRKPDGI